MVEIKELYNCETPYLKPLFDSCVYPWEMLSKINEYIEKMDKTGFTEIKTGVWVGENVEIAPTATINAPAVIGANCEIRPGAYIRGGVITGEGCVLGNSSEFKNCVLLNSVQVPHYNYVGDSVLGNFSHLGAGSICSNLKSDKKAVVIKTETPIPTNLRKVGAFLADYADIGCGCVLNPGTVVGKRTSVYPLNALRGVYEEDLIVKSNDNRVKRIDK